MDVVKRLQIMIDRELDDLLGRQARAEGCSKAALVRRYVRERLGRSRSDDALRGMAGAYTGRTADDIDEVVYGGHYRDRP
jgi:hypothetical protein